MSTLKTNNVQVGQSVTATNNFTLYQPSTPDGTVRLGNGNSGATTADVVTVTSAGNVGIGTSSPGSSGLTVYRAGGAAISLNNATTGTTASSGFQLQGGSGGDAYLWNYSNSFIAIATNNTERARIDSSGNLLVGTTSSTGISGWGLGNGIGLSNNYSGNGAFSVNSTSSTGTQYFFGFGRGGSQCGSITSTGTNSTTYATSSDYRLKQDIQPMMGALARVAALKPVTYKWKSDGSEGEGFIAHELQAVVPDAVVGEKDAVDADGNPVYQGIDTSFLVATLTAAIQELKAELDTVKAELAALKAV